MNRSMWITTSTVALAIACATSAQAQQTIDELVVTAQKREENLQDVPIVVTTLPGQLLRDTGVKDIKDLTILTPGLVVTSTQSEAVTTARIRGVGTAGDNPGLESSVGVVIDGVYRPRNGVSFGDLGQLERIEVLKGPQGTLFGKNTSAGVINVITKGPSFEFGAEGELTVGDYGAYGGSVAVTGPLVADKAAARVYFAARKRDGFLDVKTGNGPSGDDDNYDQNFWTARGQLLVTPSEALSIKFSADYTDRDEKCCDAVQIRSGTTAAIVNALAAPGVGVAVPANPGARVAYANRPAVQEIVDGGVAMEVNADLSFGVLTSITAYRHWKANSGLDTDFSGADIIYRNARDHFVEFGTFSQELRLAGETGKLNWLVGAFYADETLDNRTNFLSGASFERYLSLLLSQGANPNFVSILNGRPAGTSYAGGAGQFDRYHQRAKTLALFTNNTWHVTDQFDVTLGLRWTTEDKDLESLQSNSDGGVGCATAKQRFAGGAWTAIGIPAASQGTILTNMCLPYFNNAFNQRRDHQSSDENEWTGTIKAAYRWSPQVMTYASYARGYKGGGFNLDRTQSSNGLQSGGPGLTPIHDTSFPAEFVDSYELGIKNTLLDRSLLLNATLFHQTFTDFQLNAFLGVSFQVRPIPEVVSKGADVDLLWFTPIEGLTVQGGLTYADTRYGDDKVPNDATNGNALLPGSRLSYAPEWSSSASVGYERPVSDTLEMRFNVGAKYMSDYNTGSDLLPIKLQKAYTLVNARVSLGDQDERWTVEVWANNLFDKDYYQVAFNGPLQGASGLSATNAVYNPALDTLTYDAIFGAPRTFGATLRAKF